MVMRIVSFNDRPFAYAQDWRRLGQRQFYCCWFSLTDALIGASDMINRGHGAAFLHQLITLRPVAIDPDAANLRPSGMPEPALSMTRG